MKFTFANESAAREFLDEKNVPRYGLSCMYTMRSNDWFLGSSFNIAEYALLTHMIGNIVNMVPSELVASIGDCHLYKNHLEASNELLKRNGSNKTPRLVIHGEHECVEDFRYEDFELVDYEPDPIIKAPLSVG
jgi:thymidylate synthase